MSQRKIQLQGTLTTAAGSPLPATALSLSEVDSHQTITFTTGSTAGYGIDVPEGTWSVTIQPPQSPPRTIGTLTVTTDTQSGALSDLLTTLSPSSLDISVLGFMRGLVDEAERASESTRVAVKSVGDNRKIVEDITRQVQKLIEEARLMVSVPGFKGPPGKDGAPGKDGEPGLPGKDGSATIPAFGEVGSYVWARLSMRHGEGSLPQSFLTNGQVDGESLAVMTIDSGPNPVWSVGSSQNLLFDRGWGFLEIPSPLTGVWQVQMPAGSYNDGQGYGVLTLWQRIR